MSFSTERRMTAFASRVLEHPPMWGGKDGALHAEHEHEQEQEQEQEQESVTIPLPLGDLMGFDPATRQNAVATGITKAQPGPPPQTRYGGQAGNPAEAGRKQGEPAREATQMPAFAQKDIKWMSAALVLSTCNFQALRIDYGFATPY